MNRKQRKAMARQASAAPKPTRDSFVNFESRVGIQAANQSKAGHYTFDYVTRNRIQMEAAYRSSWVCGIAVDAVAEDMTRAGIDIHSDRQPEDIEKLNNAMERFQIWNQLCDTVKWARLYGGAICVMLIDGQQADTPLNLNAIGPGQFKGLLVLDRWLVQPSLQDLVTEYGPYMGMPKYYQVVADAQALINQRIHYSRVIRMDGVELPYWQRIAENLWGQSVLERLWDRLLAFDSTTQGTAQLVYKAHLRTYKVEGLREIIAAGGQDSGNLAYMGLLGQIDMIRRFQSNEGMTLMDAKDTFEAHQYSFAGLDNVLLQMGQQISGATQIPMVRLFGQAPAGLSGNHDGELRNYYDQVNQHQDRKLRPGLTTLLDVIHRSELGDAPDENFSFEFRPLWQLSDTEKADVAEKTTNTVVNAYDSGLITQKTALSELRNASHVSGVFSKITDEDIESANDDPPDPGEMNVPGSEIGNQPKAPGANEDLPA